MKRYMDAMLKESWAVQSHKSQAACSVHVTRQDVQKGVQENDTVPSEARRVHLFCSCLVQILHA